MPLIKGDKIIIIEDDEYYAPEYIETMARELDLHEIAGIGRSRYYHLFSSSNVQIRNIGQASLAETGFRSSFLPMFSKLLAENGTFLDIALWRKVKRSGRGFIFTDDENPLYVGIKGLPGRYGIGVGHDSDNGIYRTFPHDNESRNILRQWIPNDDFNIYMSIINKKLTEKNYQLWLKV